MGARRLGNLWLEVLPHPEELEPGEFLSGGEAWTAYREGRIDASSFGVYGTDNWGPGEIRGNLVKDLAALNKVEMLPWDVWGRMQAAYKDQAGTDYDDLLDEVAAACVPRMNQLSSPVFTPVTNCVYRLNWLPDNDKGFGRVYRLRFALALFLVLPLATSVAAPASGRIQQRASPDGGLAIQWGELLAFLRNWLGDVLPPGGTSAKVQVSK